MRKKGLLKSGIVAVSITLLASCGGGGGDSSLGSGTDLGSGSNYNPSQEYISLKSLSISDSDGNGIITPGEEFSIKWNVDYSGATTYAIGFFALPDINVPTINKNTDETFESLNCGALIDCSKGIKCIYDKKINSYTNETEYYVKCIYYSTIPNFTGWGDYKYASEKKIDPYTTNYIGANAYILIINVNPDYTIDDYTLESKEAVPVTFGF
ncbi:hypothetical protein [Persephonella sp.]